ncbi:MAG: carbohydrate ABC transporter permease, partial [Rubrivivax sp.]|nr:carbohydrate ABC transporter permease [Rubrivivax sp.]
MKLDSGARSGRSGSAGRPDPHGGRGRRSRHLGAYVINGSLALLSALTIFPLVWMLSASLMAPGEASTFPPPLLPAAPTLEHYRVLFGTQGLGRQALNSLLISVAATGLSLAFNLSAGYAFAKLKFKGRELIFRTLLAALVIPGQVAMMPLFLMLKQMGLVNTFAGALVPWLAGVFGIFLVRQYALSIPDEMLEAARVD